MTKTLDMQFIRYMNLFSNISRVISKYCFSYNNMLLFVVSKTDVQKAIGKDNQNLEKLSRILGKRIRIVAEPKFKTAEEVRLFVRVVVSPIEFNNLEVKDDEVTITAGRESKARLIGRQRIRQKELQNILEQYFGIKRVNIV